MEGKITFYRIDRCGYYKRGGENPAFGNILDTLIDLKRWAFSVNMKLNQTCTYEPSESGERGAYKTFCYDLANDEESNTFLLTTWNESPNNFGKIASVQGLDPVGNAEISLTGIPENHIPGYATYFWVIPAQDIFATVQFQHNANGRSNLEFYLRGFLSKFSRHVSYSDQYSSFEINGYRENENNEVNRHLFPQFNSSLYKKVGQIDYLRSNWRRIRQVHRRETLKFSRSENLALWQQLLRNVGLGESDPAEGEEKFQFTLNHTPSEAELGVMINFWEDQQNSNKWDDLGFKLEGESEIRWLSHSVAKCKLNLNLNRKNDEIVEAEPLLHELVAKKEEILKVIKDI